MRHHTSTEIPVADSSRLITDEEATAYIVERGVLATSSTLRTMRHNRRGPPYYQIAGRAMYRRADLDAYIASRRVDPGAHDCTSATPPRGAATPSSNAQREENGA
jgi:hypothetical protein